MMPKSIGSSPNRYTNEKEEAENSVLSVFTMALKEEDYLLERLWVYVFQSEYSRYTSVKEEEWRMALRGVGAALIKYLETQDETKPFHVDENYQNHPAAAFILKEAKRHRERGVRFDMFLGLFKMTRQAFVDLIYDLKLTDHARKQALTVAYRLFDKMELAFTTEWARQQETDLIHDLQITNRRMTNEKNRYQTIFQSMAEPAFVVDRSMRIVETNKAFEDFYKITGPQLVGEKCSSVFNYGLCDNCPLEKAMKESSSFSNIEAAIPSDGDVKTVLVAGSFLDDISGRYAGGMVILQDISERKKTAEALRKAHDELEQKVDERTAELITANEQLKKEIKERRRAETAMRESERRYRALVDFSSDHIFMLSREGIYITSNDQVGQFELDNGKSLVGLSLKHIYPKEFSDYYIKQLELVHTTGRENVFEIPIQVSDKYFYHLITLYPILNEGRVLAVGGISRDITDRKKNEEFLKESEQKLRFLSAQLINAQETERKRIAYELHDELGQALMVLKLQLLNVHETLTGSQSLIKESLEKAIENIQEITENVRRLSRDLSPSILQDLGLSAALHWLIKETANHYNIEIIYDIEDIQNIFSEEEKIIIFRIFQEAFTNIGKHAQADQIILNIEKLNGDVSFVVKDDGEGFVVEQAFSKDPEKMGLGLTTMAERTRMLGGSFSIWSQKGKGTRISFTIPNNKGAIS
jgi:PAS domain S-box-containing protein